MNRKRQLTISLSAAVLSGLLVYGVYLLQLRHIRLEETERVVVPRQFVPAGTALDRGMLTTVSVPRGAVTGEMFTRVEEAVGLEAYAPLGSNEPLLKWKLDKFRLLPRPGEATFQIPREYVKSVSNGIRAGDRVVVYLSAEANVSRRLFPSPVVIAAVKTASNQEIDNPKNSNLLSLAEGDKERMYASRRDANGSIDAINLNLTEAQWLELDNACKGGAAKLVIAFDASTFDAAEGGKTP
ncbi:SAF domain-containing protein [Cohnella nanjingensis]|uniref:Flagellar biosynthesis protein FlgA n=1 Tax=Cohnella nanjingensis TaxID=1387779 RepID=A0A7X0RSB3_9BACL|nr:SAF domain-containing protein [Cohnella nanjingensis]MBB6672583.1 flagellar biosynthesis protein FlgA [Cohnella nanjingensis]